MFIGSRSNCVFNMSAKHKKLGFRKIVSGFILLTFLSGQIWTPSMASAQSASMLNLPMPGAMVGISPSYVPIAIKGIQVFPDNPLKLDFIIDPANSGLRGEALKIESSKLIKYFLASLTIPEDDHWVNLSPYEKDRIIAEEFGKTEMGRDMLAQDYILKQLTASLIYPEKDLGKSFWNKVYDKAQKLYGTTDIPVNTFNKVWIVPEKAVVYENKDVAFVIESHLKVMLEGDYLALKENLKNEQMGSNQLEAKDVKQLSDVSSQIIKEVVLPEIEKEVNEGENFAPLRQIYYSMILASWFKRNLKKSILGEAYVGKNKIFGIDVDDKQVKEKIYQQYLEAFKKGAFNYIKEDYDETGQEVVAKKYFSGGTAFMRLNKEVNGQPAILQVVTDKASAEHVRPDDSFFRASINLLPEQVSETGAKNYLGMGLGDGARGTRGLPGQMTLASAIQSYETAVRQNNINGISVALQQARSLLPDEEVEFLSTVMNINVPDVVIEVMNRLAELFRQNAKLRTPALIRSLEGRRGVWESHGFTNVTASIGQALNAGTISPAPIEVLRSQSATLDSLRSAYQAAIRRQNLDGITSVIRDAQNLSPDDELQLLTEIITINAPEIVIRVVERMGQIFLLKPGLKIASITKQLERSREIWNSYGVVQVTDAIDRALEIGGEIEKAKAESAGQFDKRLATELDIFRIGIERDNNPKNVDQLVANFERFIRESLTQRGLSAVEQSAVGKAAAQAALDLRKIAVPHGFIIEQSPSGLSDERAFVVYKIDATTEETTTQGAVKTHYIKQVTRFSDGLLRGNPGWSSLFTDDVIVFRDYVEQSKLEELQKVIEGELPFRAVDTSSLKGKRIDRMARIARKFILKSAQGKTPDALARLEEEALRYHETEHEVRRRLLNLQDGDRVYGGLEEELAELKSMIRLLSSDSLASREKAYDVLAHIIELAASDTQFAWSVLSRITNVTDHDGILDKLDQLADIPTALSSLDTQVLAAHQQVDQEWGQSYSLAKGGQTFDPYTGRLAYNTKLDNQSGDVIPLNSNKNKPPMVAPESSTAKTAPVGGIDFNSNLLELKTIGNGVDFNMPFNPQRIGNTPIQGFTFDLYITPLVNLPMLLGLSENKETQKLSSIR